MTVAQALPSNPQPTPINLPSIQDSMFRSTTALSLPTLTSHATLRSHILSSTAWLPFGETDRMFEDPHEDSRVRIGRHGKRCC